MKRFEYHIHTLKAGGFTGGKVDIDEMDREANRLGAGGWEMVSAVDTSHAQGGTRCVILIFKRERAENE